MARYETTSFAQSARKDGWSPLRQRLDVQAFGINAWSAKDAGDTLINDHDEVPSGHEEFYLVTVGHATFTVDGDELDGPAGTAVFVADPALKRKAVAVEAGTTVLVVGGKPGEAYKPRSWETNAQVFELFDEGKFAEARAMLLEGLDRYDDRGALLFNLACAEARLGDVDAAFGYLERGVAERPGLVELAREDDDLASLRDDPRFDALLGRATTG